MRAGKLVKRVQSDLSNCYLGFGFGDFPGLGGDAL